MDAFSTGSAAPLPPCPIVPGDPAFEPWISLAFTGSIGDIERVNVAQLAAFYGDAARWSSPPRRAGVLDRSPGDSSNIAIAPGIFATTRCGGSTHLVHFFSTADDERRRGSTPTAP
jgi:hypothetical protein